ncbi:uncharacterized protein BCR38DRAFT_479447 [Pseudomassariella vexata]|uniref:Uncharacterized protein n=1 Tax=Pseudomassariella vexata TaxID=1141098 RepID=A0A1Y2EH62_9PEZI|nr:uncharacterized protein BCR38DRAFT_479447 [Pseudomassariella vexata]ORY70913.1 hypothetical protein BCR38DRAFT_479447 [Pseudomassariella vexata]
MNSWLSRPAPVLVPNDTVLPIRYWVDTVVLKPRVVYALSRYNAALDAQNLHSSLEGPVARWSWRKFGPGCLHRRRRLLAAWWHRLTVSPLVLADSTRTIGKSTNTKRPHTSNLFSLVYTLVPARYRLVRPFSGTAEKIRRAIIKERTKEQVETCYAYQR